MIHKTWTYTIVMAVLFTAPCLAQPGQKTEYRIYNPSYHYFPSGDPTGLFYLDGKYYNNWGAAYSTDLVHWRYTEAGMLYRKLAETSLSKAGRDSLLQKRPRLGGSGSVIVDLDNTSGFGKNGKPPLISLWHNNTEPWGNQVIGLAYSNDTAKTWIRYDKFPLLDINSREFRDPLVFWYAPAKKWVMVIGEADVPKIKFFSSPNLKDWELMSDFGPWGAVGGVWECASFFPLAVDNDPTRIKWVLAISVQPLSAQYFIGDFDGYRFTLDSSFVQALSYDKYVPAGKVLFDFERGIDEWQMQGDAFVESPASKALLGQGAIMGMEGRFFINSFHRKAASTGKITSPSFRITKNHINFLAGGGYHPGEESINLLINGKAVRSQTGNNSGGLQWTAWDVSEFMGKQAQIEITDQLKDGSGYIYADHFMLSDEPADTGREKAFWIDHGPDFFAVREWGNYPQSETRRIWTAWMGSWRYGGTEPVKGIQSVPRSVGLKTFPEGIRLIQTPIKELETLRISRRHAGEHTFEGIWKTASISTSRNTYEMIVEFENESAEEIGIKLCVGKNQKAIAGYSFKREELYVDRRSSGLVSFTGLFPQINKGILPNRNNKLKLHIFVDNCSVEVFANDGESVISSKIFPDPQGTGIEFFSSGGQVKIKSVDLWELAPVELAGAVRP